MIDNIKFDKDTQDWFYLHPFAETTLQKCEKCGLYFKPILGHKCRGEVIGNGQ